MDEPRKQPQELLFDVLRTLRSYVRGQVLVSVIMVAVYAGGFVWAQVPLWFLAALICGFSHLIPVVGAYLALTFPILFVVIAGGDFGQVLRVLAVFGGGQLLENLYLSPKILGRELRLSPFLVFFAVLAGGLAFGVLGALLAPPAAAVAMLLWRSSRKRGQTDSRP